MNGFEKKKKIFGIMKLLSGKCPPSQVSEEKVIEHRSVYMHLHLLLRL